MRNETTLVSLARAVMLVLPCVSFVHAGGDSFASLCYTLPPEAHARCLSVLRRELRSNEFGPSIHAAEALTLIGQTGEVRTIMQSRLHAEEQDSRRCGFAREIVRAGDESKIDVLLEVLAASDVTARVHAAESMYKISRTGNGNLLRTAFSSSQSEKLRMMAAAALGRQGSHEAISYLRQRLSDEYLETAGLAAWVLSRIGDAPDIPALRENLQRAETSLTRCYFHHALANLGDGEGKQALTRNLSSEDPLIRTYAAAFAGESGIVAAADELIRRLGDKHPDARVRAAHSLLLLSRLPVSQSAEGRSRPESTGESKEHPVVPKQGVIRLFNGRNFDGLYTWLQDTKYEDPRQVFQVTDGMLHISGDGLGGIVSRNEYRDYHLILEFSWGDRNFGRRKASTKDSGLLVHCTGSDGGPRGDGPWMLSIEAQIIEGGVGDFIIIGTSLSAEVTKDRDGESVWTKGGQRETFIRWADQLVRPRPGLGGQTWFSRQERCGKPGRPLDPHGSHLRRRADHEYRERSGGERGIRRETRVRKNLHSVQVG